MTPMVIMILRNMAIVRVPLLNKLYMGKNHWRVRGIILNED